METIEELLWVQSIRTFGETLEQISNARFLCNLQESISELTKHFQLISFIVLLSTSIQKIREINSSSSSSRSMVSSTTSGSASISRRWTRVSFLLEILPSPFSSISTNCFRMAWLYYQILSFSLQLMKEFFDGSHQLVFEIWRFSKVTRVKPDFSTARVRVKREETKNEPRAFNISWSTMVYNSTVRPVSIFFLKNRLLSTNATLKRRDPDSALTPLTHPVTNSCFQCEETFSTYSSHMSSRNTHTTSHNFSKERFTAETHGIERLYKVNKVAIIQRSSNEWIKSWECVWIF